MIAFWKFSGIGYGINHYISHLTIPDVRYEQIDDAPYDYISDFCDERKYKESTFERLVDQIDFRNEVFVFLERNGVI